MTHRSIRLDVAGKPILVVGAGHAATQEIRALLQAGADLRVVAPAASDAVRELAASSRLSWDARPYRPGDLDGAMLVLACTGLPDIDRAVESAAAALGVWCMHGSADVETVGAWVAVSSRAPAASPGDVVLVGGGPGDPDLITVRGLRALLNADVVISDRLGPTDLFRSLDASVEVIDVGKTPRGPAASQDDINALLIARARAGQRVVRLKGGDPFIYGRGGEEVQACVAAGIPVHVVPGISSVTAAPALAGIPLTHRGLTQHFVVASGHVPPGDPRSSVDWRAIGAAGGTIVLLMAVENRAAIAAELIDAGMSHDTPVAVVENASTCQQRTATTTLAGLARQPARPPAVIVIGDVVNLVEPAEVP